LFSRCRRYRRSERVDKFAMNNNAETVPMWIGSDAPANFPPSVCSPPRFKVSTLTPCSPEPSLRRHYRQPTIKANPSAQLALCVLHRNGKGPKTWLFCPIKTVGAVFQVHSATRDESLGKEKDSMATCQPSIAVLETKVQLTNTLMFNSLEKEF